VAAIDTPFVDIGDLAGLADDAGRAVDFGFDAKLAIHPSQIAPIRDAFTPGARDVERARGIVAAATGGGVNTYEGTMIDMPLVIAARRVLARAGASA
jgi:citrate lyase subunit beta/citryl-CoA lyase